MLDIPLHHIPNKLEKEFKIFLKKVNIPERVFLLNDERKTLVFFHVEQAVLCKKDLLIKSDIKELAFSSLKFTVPLLVGPCLRCNYKGRLCDNKNKVMYSYCENLFLEDYFTQEAHLYFKTVNIKSLYDLSRNILEHYNPTSSIAHFYIGFCFFSYGDMDNYHTSIKKLQKYNKKMAVQLDKLVNLQNKK